MAKDASIILRVRTDDKAAQAALKSLFATARNESKANATAVTQTQRQMLNLAAASERVRTQEARTIRVVSAARLDDARAADTQARAVERLAREERRATQEAERARRRPSPLAQMVLTSRFNAPGGGAQPLVGRTAQAFGLSGNAAAVGAVAAGAAGVVAAGAISAGKAAVDLAADLEQTLDVLQVQIKATDEQMGRLSARARELGDDVKLPGIASVDAARGMQELAKQGLSVQDTMDGAEGALRLAIAASIDAGTAAGFTASQLNAFGLAGTEATRVADLLAATANSSGADIGDLMLAAQQASAAFHAAKMPIEDMYTALGLLANAGIKGSDAGTSLRVALSRMTTSGTDAAKMLEDLEVKVYDNAGRTRSLADIMGQLERRLQNATDEQRKYVAQVVFGEDGQRSFNILLEAGAAGFAAMKKNTTEAGAAAAVAEAKAKGLRGAVDGLNSTLQTLGEKRGAAVVGAFTSIIRTGDNLVSMLDRWIERMEKAGTVAGWLSRRIKQNFSDLEEAARLDNQTGEYEETEEYKVSRSREDLGAIRTARSILRTNEERAQKGEAPLNVLTPELRGTLERRGYQPDGFGRVPGDFEAALRHIEVDAGKEVRAFDAKKKAEKAEKAEAAKKPAGKFKPRQLEIAKTIYAEGQAAGASPQQMLAAFEAALVESEVQNLAGGDRDSAGVFQQRPDMKWGSHTQVTDPAYAARAFFQGAGTNPGAAAYPDFKGTAGELAQKVQRSGYPDRYDKREADARALLAAIGVTLPPSKSPSFKAPAQGTGDPTIQAMIDGAGAGKGGKQKVTGQEALAATLEQTIKHSAGVDETGKMITATCSALVRESLKAAGIPHLSAEKGGNVAGNLARDLEARGAKRFPLSEAQRGDVVVYEGPQYGSKRTDGDPTRPGRQGYHVGIALGAGQFRDSRARQATDKNIYPPGPGATGYVLRLGNEVSGYAPADVRRTGQERERAEEEAKRRQREAEQDAQAARLQAARGTLDRARAAFDDALQGLGAVTGAGAGAGGGSLEAQRNAAARASAALLRQELGEANTRYMERRRTNPREAAAEFANDQDAAQRAFRERRARLRAAFEERQQKASERIAEALEQEAGRQAEAVSRRYDAYDEALRMDAEQLELDRQRAEATRDLVRLRQVAVALEDNAIRQAQSALVRGLLGGDPNVMKRFGVAVGQAREARRQTDEDLRAQEVENNSVDLTQGDANGTPWTETGPGAALAESERQMRQRIEDLGDHTHDVLADAFERAATGDLGGALKQVASDFGQEVRRELAGMAASAVVRAIFGGRNLSRDARDASGWMVLGAQAIKDAARALKESAREAAGGAASAALLSRAAGGAGGANALGGLPGLPGVKLPAWAGPAGIALAADQFLFGGQVTKTVVGGAKSLVNNSVGKLFGFKLAKGGHTKPYTTGLVGEEGWELAFSRGRVAALSEGAYRSRASEFVLSHEQSRRLVAAAAGGTAPAGNGGGGRGDVHLHYAHYGDVNDRADRQGLMHDLTDVLYDDLDSGRR